MIEMDPGDSPNRSSTARLPARDSRGRWVRSAATPQEFKEFKEFKEVEGVEDVKAVDAVKDREFVFDDRVIEHALPAGANQLSLPPDDTETEPENGTDTEAGSRPLVLDPLESDFHRLSPVDAFPQEAEPVSRRRRAPLYWSLGAALLLGVAYFGFQQGIFATRSAVVSPPPPAAPIVAPVVAPPPSKKTVRPPAASARVAPSSKKDEKTAAAIAPVVAPRPPERPSRPPATPAVAAAAAPAPEPASPTAATAAQPVPSPSPADPEPSPPAASEPIPTVAPSTTISDEEGWFRLAEEYLQMGDESSAEALYRRILGSGTQRGRAALALGDLFAKRNDFGRAQEFYRVSKQLYQGGVQPASTP